MGIYKKINPMDILSFDWMLSAQIGFDYKQRVLQTFLGHIDRQIESQDISVLPILESFHSMLVKTYGQIKQEIEHGGILNQNGEEVYMAFEYAIPRVHRRIMDGKAMLNEISLNTFTFRINLGKRFSKEAFVVLDNDIDNMELYHIRRKQNGEPSYTHIQSIYNVDCQSYEQIFNKLVEDNVIPEGMHNFVIFNDMQIPYHESFLPVARIKVLHHLPKH